MNLFFDRGRPWSYTLFAVAYGMVWYLFKLGGIPKPGLALLSTAIDLFFSLFALIITVEIMIPRGIYKKAYWTFGFLFFLVVFITGSAIIVSQLKLFGYGFGDYQKNMIRYKEHFFYWFWSDLVLGSYFLVSFISLGGIAVRLAFDRLVTANQMETLEKEKSQATLESLKNQINPHFLFNALNTIYYKIDRDNPSARSMVEQFSSLLRYQLYECDRPEVEIGKELRSIANYIELQKERVSKNMIIIYDIGKEINNFFIAPFILMPIVENCFKHVSQFTEQGNFIKIHGYLENGWFCFKTVNTTSRREEGNTSGIGLANITKRLELVYPDSYMLETGDQGGVFDLTLKIQVQ
jgi:two-component system LytT family sensor kinase